jgi:hypothetical protein
MSNHVDSKVVQDATSSERRGLPNVLVYMDYAHFASEGTMLYATSQGFIGLAPVTLAEGDTAVLINGSNFPMILRDSGNDYIFRYLAYIHRIWHGELKEARKERDVMETEFVVVWLPTIATKTS